MTQIKKTLSIAGIIALVTAPVMADIASTDYVQSIVNNVIPKTGTAGHVLKKTASGVEWAAAPSVPANVLSNNATGQNAIAIGNGAKATVKNAIQLGEGTNDKGGLSVGLTYWDDENEKDVSVNYELLNSYGRVPEDRIALSVVGVLQELGIIMGQNDYQADVAMLLGGQDEGYNYDAIAIGRGAYVDAEAAIQLGAGSNGVANTFQVFDTMLLNSDGIVPATALATEIPDACKVDGQECALVAKWNSAQNKFIQSWEVVKVSE